jgi:superfamily II DNA helicase RecQ
LVQSAWLQGEISVICATIAYGMGIDMPSVRYVVHLSLAKSLEGYYQEAGRAGRDGNYSECIVMYNRKDVDRLARIMSRPRLAAKDRELLEEMQDYCENQLSCRRQTFSDKFTETRARLPRCRGMCDNCKHQAGAPRRSFLPTHNLQYKQLKTQRSQSQSKSSSTVAGKKRKAVEELEEIDDDGWGTAKADQTSRQYPKVALTSVPKAGFVKASCWTSETNEVNKLTSRAAKSTTNNQVYELLDEVSDDEDWRYLEETCGSRKGLDDKNQPSTLSSSGSMKGHNHNVTVPKHSEDSRDVDPWLSAASRPREVALKPTFVKASSLKTGNTEGKPTQYISLY